MRPDPTDPPEDGHQRWPVISRVYAVLTVLLTVAGVFLYVRWTSGRQGSGLPVLLFTLIPAAYSASATWATRRFRRRQVNVLAIALSIVVFPGFLLMACTVEFCASSAPVTDPTRYCELVSRRHSQPNGLTCHFPATIPAYARNVRFHFDPGLWQASTIFQLRYATSPERIETLYAHFRPQATHSFHGGESTDHRNREGGTATTWFFTTDGDDLFSPFPEDYEILVLLPSERWNHGRTRGVAISRQRNEIVYWAESW